MLFFQNFNTQVQYDQSGVSLQRVVVHDDPICLRAVPRAQMMQGIYRTSGSDSKPTFNSANEDAHWPEFVSHSCPSFPGGEREVLNI